MTFNSLDEEPKRICEFLKKKLADTGKRGYVIGLSGGIDSTVMAVLLNRAVGNKHILAIMMPYDPSGQGGTSLAYEGRVVAEWLGIPNITTDIYSSVRYIERGNVSTKTELLLGEAGIPGNIADSLEAKRNLGNIKARCRMTTLYFAVARMNYLVCGTTNRTEAEIGYYTKWGDGGVDIEPLAHLYKTQVIALAWKLGIPGHMIKRQPTAGLWGGQTDEGEMGITYERLDKILSGGKPTNRTESNLVKGMIKASEHKRKPIPKVV